MIAALSQPEPGKRIPLFSSREHQDAQELFQLVSEYVKKEATAVSREGTRDLGFGGLSSLSSLSMAATSADVSKGVFDGLTANRRSCCECGYTEAVMHFPFDNWQLTVPRVVRSFPLLPAPPELSTSVPGGLQTRGLPHGLHTPGNLVRLYLPQMLDARDSAPTGTRCRTAHHCSGRQVVCVTIEKETRA
jgi:hypothetical protein